MLFVVVATTRKPLQRGTGAGRSSIFSTLSKTMSLSEGSADFKRLKSRRIMVSGVGWSLVSIFSSFFSSLASSTRSLVMDSVELAFTHATRLQCASSHCCAKVDASWVLPQPRMPTRTVRCFVGSVISAFKCSCSLRSTNRFSATTSGRLPKKTRLGSLSLDANFPTMCLTSSTAWRILAADSRLSLSFFNDCLAATCR